ncbi:MAG: thiamine-binding protein [Bernardetiaceae bacterium]|nr:thiamine-binding protein [Bernardetiaceae bacterium]
MRISLEISLYPLNADYKPLVKGFIALLSSNNHLEIRVNGMSTQVFGELSEVMPTLEKAIAQSFEKDKMAVVMKMLATDVSQYEYKPLT